jgi:hypothetical protein
MFQIKGSLVFFGNKIINYGKVLKCGIRKVSLLGPSTFLKKLYIYGFKMIETRLKFVLTLVILFKVQL